VAIQREEEEITPGVARESRHISEWVDCAADVVYDYASDPAHLPEWAHGLGNAVERVGDEWFVATGMGRVGFAFVPRNELGVLDHRVTLPSGETFYNPMRVVPDRDGCEVVFTLRREAGMSDDDFERDAATVKADLVTLRQLLESRRPRHK
jgi:hypothetical protein